MGKNRSQLMMILDKVCQTCVHDHLSCLGATYLTGLRLALSYRQASSIDDGFVVTKNQFPVPRQFGKAVLVSGDDHVNDLLDRFVIRMIGMHQRFVRTNGLKIYLSIHKLFTKISCALKKSTGNVRAFCYIKNT